MCFNNCPYTIKYGPNQGDCSNTGNSKHPDAWCNEGELFERCSVCGDLCDPDNLQDGICEDCWDDECGESVQW